MSRHLTLIAVGILALAGAAAAHPVTGMTALFPDARTESKIERGGVALQFGKSSLYLTPVRLQPLPDRQQPRNAFWCGVALSAGGMATQAVVTVGKGFTEVLSCQGLVAAGVVPPNGRTRRIGLIYDLNSPTPTCAAPSFWHVTRPAVAGRSMKACLQSLTAGVARPRRSQPCATRLARVDLAVIERGRG